MPQARQYKDPLGSETWTGNAMVNAFGHACGGQRMLRGEQLYRTGKVTDIEVKTRDAKDTCVSARVLSQDHRPNAPSGAYTTSINFAAFTAAETQTSCKLLVKDNAWARLEQAWLSKRCLMQRGCTVEAEPLIKALHPIPLLPQVWTQRATASCNCGDFASHSWCKHVAALGYHLIDTCGAQPFYLCHLRQFDLDGLLRSRLPRKRARDSRSDEVIALLSDDEESDSGTRHGASCNNPIVL